MALAVVVIVLIFLALALGLAGVALRREKSPPPPIAERGNEIDAAANHALQQALDERGTELLQRRVDLDMRRGTLGGNSEIYEAFEDLEGRLRAGEITEEEFEREKIKLLGGREMSAPEYEDCARVARAAGVTLRAVYAAAQQDVGTPPPPSRHPQS